MRAFIVRPFGEQGGVDFDRMQRELIEPALARLRSLGTQIDGGTTGLISKAGNIREDMFRLLAVSDLVIADVTIHNANAFYELGVRHALRPGSTQLIRAKGVEVKYPFDLQTDRYFQYELDVADPAQAQKQIEALAQSIRATLAERRDSPIFLLLKDLKPHGRGDLVKVPDDFREAVETARKTERRGDLRLLAHESDAFEWDREGLTLVGEAQFKLRAYVGARDTFELLRVAAPNDYHPNWRLGTIFQRLASAATGADKEDFTSKSEQAISRVLDSASAAQKAELNGLLGSNAKNRWTADYRDGGADPVGQRALESSYLERMLACYLSAAAFDLDEHYPAINALAFLKAQIQLAKLFPDSWAGLHADPAGELDRREKLAERLSANLRLTLRLDDAFKAYQSPPDPWAKSSIADFTLISDPTKGAFIGSRYRDANSGADRFSLEANRRNLDILKELGLFEPGISAAIKVIDEETRKQALPERRLKRALLFTGHLVDAASRPPEKARFPRTAQAEQTARQLIFDAVKKEIGGDAADTVGIAGGACGGDILFHEVCAELGIETELFLALPPAQFQAESVQPGGDDWVARFQALCRKEQPRVLQNSMAPPDWLASLGDYSIWERNNLWMMYNTLATGADKQTLIALFNEDQDPDGPGGTRHLLEVARQNGLRTVPIDARLLLK